jgi:poly(hydroxyalkanoate) granule-associated protein
MVKKFKAMAEEAGRFGRFGAGDSQLAAAIKESAQQIWLAGLGAFAKAQEEGQKVFNTLVKQGSVLHQRTRSATEEKVGDVTGKVSQMTGEFQKQASEGWDKLEQVFEDRVARALNRLGVPTNKDVAALSRQVEILTAAVSQLSAADRPARKPAKPAKEKAAAPAKSGKSVAKSAAKSATKKTASRKKPAEPAEQPAAVKKSRKSAKPA